MELDVKLMRESYSPWEFSGYAWMGTRRALDKLNDGDVDGAKENLNEIIEQFHILNKVNGLKES